MKTPKTNPTKLKGEKFNQVFTDYIHRVNQQYGLSKSAYNRLLRVAQEIH